jgi:hypothetical protein
MDKHMMYIMIGGYVLLLAAAIIHHILYRMKQKLHNRFFIEKFWEFQRLREEHERALTEKKTLEEILLNVTAAQPLAAVSHPPEPPPTATPDVQ